MGNGKSRTAGLCVDEKPFLTSNFYTIHNATIGIQPERKVTVFEGILDNKSQVPAVDRFSKNVMLHRHPNILKYIASWNDGNKFYLATEEVQPLQHVLSSLTPLQVCIGIHSILKAVHFLHEKALSSHNNISQASVYVTLDGQWKLGGMEYLCRFSDLNVKFLSESRHGRYDNGISRGEDVKVPDPPSAIDKFAFGVFLEEVLSSKLDENVPGSIDFLHIAKNSLQSENPKERPSFEALLNHSFFNHEFIAIHNFLTELPLKTDNDKQLFFRELNHKLGEYKEDVVASQMGSLLLSRIVLLDVTAQKFLLPQILSPRIGDNGSCLFSEETFKKYIAPKIMSIFCVRDIQVRLTLLRYFKSYCAMFTPTQLHVHILPELLVGIKDTNDNLVSATLQALADLVPILGSAAVIGGKRAKHFSDGRPKANVGKDSKKNKTVKLLNIEPPGEESGEIFLSERLSPDGGEEPSSPSTENDVEQWDSWDSPNIQAENINKESNNLIMVDIDEINHVESETPENVIVKLETVEPKQVTPSEEEIDFFHDMVPIISKANVLKVVDNKFNGFEAGDEECTGEGWGDDGLEWATVSDSDTEAKRHAIENIETSSVDA